MVKSLALGLARGAYIAGLATVTWDQFLALEVSGFHVKFAYFPLTAAFLLALFAGIERPANLPRRCAAILGPLVRTPWVFMGLFVAVCFALTAVSPVAKKSIGYSLWGAFDLIAYVATGLYLFASGRPEEGRWRDRLVAGWIAGIVLVAAIAIVDFVAYFLGAEEGLIGSFQPHVMRLTAGGLPRPQAFSYEPSYLALAICLAQPTLVIRLLSRGRPKPLEVIAFVLLTTAMVLIFSRTGFLLFGIECAIVFGLLFRRVKPSRMLGFAGGFAALVLIVYALIPGEQREAINDRFFRSLVNQTDESGEDRLHRFTRGLELARANPLGSGPGSAMHRWLAVYTPEQGVEDYAQQQTSMMSVWPEVLVEEGVLGFALAIAFFVALGIALARNPSLEARGIFVAYLAVIGVGLLLTPTIWRADLWSLIALAGIMANPTGEASGASRGERR